MTDPPFRVTVSGCIHPPAPNGLGPHACAHQCTIWLLGPDGWHRVGMASIHRANHVLSVCETWADVLLFAVDLGLTVPR